MNCSKGSMIRFRFLKNKEIYESEKRIQFYNALHLLYNKIVKNTDRESMTYTTTSHLGPENTPKPIFQLVLWTTIITIVSALIQSIFIQFSLGTGPQDLLSLSWWGIRNWYLWQPLTFLFVQTIPPEGITLFYLITLFFNMYILWIMGSTLLDIAGVKSFFTLYFLSGIIAGVMTLLFMPVVGRYTVLAGPTPSLLAIIMAWTMVHPKTEILLFFLIPIKAKWLMVGIIGVLLLMTLSQWNFIDFIFYSIGIIFGYLYAVIAWGLQGPFPFMNSFDKTVIALSSQISQKLPTWGKNKDQSISSKIIDISTGKDILSDDQFVDAMLTKISQKGERSLTRAEKERLKKISELKGRERK